MPDRKNGDMRQKR